VPKLVSPIKYLRVEKCIVAKLGVAVGAYFFNPINAHVKNKKLYASTWKDTIAT
jgi:hypothetical protein